MPLTPEDVQNKEFTTVRLREGYDMQEVDEFLDEVETELSRMHRENEELRDKLAAVTRGGGLASAAGPMGAPQRPAEGQGPKPPPSAAPTPGPTRSSAKRSSATSRWSASWSPSVSTSTTKSRT